MSTSPQSCSIFPVFADLRISDNLNTPTTHTPTDNRLGPLSQTQLAHPPHSHPIPSLRVQQDSLSHSKSHPNFNNDQEQYENKPLPLPPPASDWASQTSGGSSSIKSPSPASFDSSLPSLSGDTHSIPSSGNVIVINADAKATSTHIDKSVNHLNNKPKPPPRSPLRQKSMTNLRPKLGNGLGIDLGESPETIRMMNDIDLLSTDVTNLLNKIYEIEELRHAVTSNVEQAFNLLPPTPATRLDNLLRDTDRIVPALKTKVEVLLKSIVDTQDVDRIVLDALEDLMKDWSKAEGQYALLKEEMKEDAWLVRFRTTAEQAEGMMDSLQASLLECTQYVGRILSSTSPIPLIATDDLLSIEHLKTMAGSHSRLKSTYVPSVDKILIMMEKSVSERTTKNGETLRRLGDMMAKWSTLQKQLSQLDAKIQLVISQHDPQCEEPDVEILADPTPGYDNPDDLFEFGGMNSAYPIDGKCTLRRGGPGSGSSVSVNSISGGTRTGGTRTASTTKNNNLTPDMYRSIRRQPSKSPSVTSGHTAKSPNEKPRWNISTKPMDNLTYVPMPVPLPGSGPVTPVSKRLSSHGHGSGSLGLRNLSSPTPSAPSGIPISSSRIPSMKGTPLGTQPPRSMSSKRMSRNSSSGAPPPSSFRSVTPTPQTRSRPSSRLSMTSASGFGPRATTLIGGGQSAATLKPFEPSKYDLLDQEVQRALDETGFNGFVSRIDPPLRKTQRMKSDDQWKGEFVFGAGEKSTNVKLLELAGRFGDPTRAARTKCMVRTGGAWQDLTSYLQSKVVR